MQYLYVTLANYKIIDYSNMKFLDFDDVNAAGMDILKYFLSGALEAS